jgi:uncharacterized protein (TIGR04255 family)
VVDIAGYGNGVVLSARFGELDEAPLDRSPIVSVVWQLRFEDHPALVAPQTVLRFQEALGEFGPFKLNMLPKVQISVQAGGVDPENAPAPATSAGGGGWRLTAADGAWQLSAESGSLAVEATRYGTWEKDFAPRLQSVLDALREVGSPLIESRLGLRYINVLTGSAVGKPPILEITELPGLVTPWLLGPLNDPTVRNAVQASQGRVVFTFDQVNIMLNHGVIATDANELGYLIDIDAFREGGRALKLDEVINFTSELHATALGVFQHSLTPYAQEAMRSSSSDVRGD